MYSFDDGKKRLTVQSRIRRIVDLTVPNLPDSLQSDRVDQRLNRCLPALLCPWENGKPVLHGCVFVLTSNIASEGFAVVLQQPFREPEAVLAFWLGDEITPEPWFFLGSCKGLRPLGGGFLTLGIHVTEFARSGCRGEFAELAPWVERLRPTEIDRRPAENNLVIQRA